MHQPSEFSDSLRDPAIDAVYYRAYNLYVEYEWDEEKAAANLRKHGIDFADAALVLEDEFVLTMGDLYTEDEVRFVALGCDPQGRLLVVVYTWRRSESV